MTADVPGASAVADVLDLWGERGCLTPPLQPVVAPAGAVVAPVVTVQIEAAPSGAGYGAMYDLLSSDLTGAFVVVAGATAVAGAVWGELLTLAAAQRGAVGVCVDGWVRDRADLERIGLPVYASGFHVAGPAGAAQVVATGGRVSIGGVEVGTGDHVLADGSGCVRIPAAALEAVLTAGRTYAAAEARVAAALLAGEPLREAYRHKRVMLDELRHTAAAGAGG